ncbi:MAG: sulfatase-like hydrolase/transferase [bacterium]|nr:sulfatase-like hydrolase/transferase [bacterium]
MFRHRYSVKTVSFLLIIVISLGMLLLSCRKEYTIYSDVIGELEFIKDSLDRSIEFQDGTLKQPEGSSLTYYTKLPQALELYVDIRAKTEEMTVSVSVHTDTIAPQIFEIKTNGSHRFDLDQFSGHLVGIHLAVDSKAADSGKSAAENSSLEWNSIVLRSVKNQESEKQSVQESPVELPDLNGYDVIYLVLDAFDAKHASVYGYEKKTTPFLDEFAKEALVFENMFANAPYTLASTGILFTSKYARESGLISEKDLLSRIIPTISELLGGADIPSYLISVHGYLIGDWGLSRGFSEIIKGNFGHGPAGHPEDAFNALKKLYKDESREQQKFIYIHLGPPHSPYFPPERFRTFVPEIESEKIEATNDNLHKIDRGQLKINDEQLEYITGWYDSNILYADDLAQKMIERLDELGVLERAIVIITSDHGEGLMQHKRMLHGSTLFDEMIHIPFIVRLPNALNVSPRRISHIASLIDVTPTLADIYGIEPADFSGKSLLPMIFHDRAVKPFIYSEALVFKNLRTIRDLEYKYISSPKQKMLFDLTNDPLEQHNLAKKLPVRTGYYNQLLHRWMQQYPETFSAGQMDMDTQDAEVLDNLKDLGYIQ